MLHKVKGWASRRRGALWGALVLVFAMVGTAGATAGAMLHLGVANTASTTTTLRSAVNGTVLQISNTNRAGGTSPRGLGITVPAGRAPITVNRTAGKARNLDADKLDGLDQSAFLRTTGKAADAAHADVADSATSATNAANADTLDGLDSAGFYAAGSKVADSADADHADVADSAANASNAQNANNLDGLDSSMFLRSSGKAADADRLDGVDSTQFLRTTGKAADAETLDGIDSSAFMRYRPIVVQGGAHTKDAGLGGCTVAATWTECATVRLDVPANETWTVAIQSDGSFFKYNASTRVRICTSVRRLAEPVGQDKCLNVPTGITLTNELNAASTNGMRVITGGPAGTSWIVSTLVNPDHALDWYNGYDHTVVHTLVTAHR